MPRTIPTAALVGMMDQETSEAYLILLRLDYDGGTIRFTSDSVETVWNGNTYEVYPFDIVLPTNEQGRVSEAQLTVDNVDRRIIAELRSFSTPMDVSIGVIASSNVSSSPQGGLTALFTDFKLRSVTYTSTTISGRLTVEDFLQEPYPKTIFSQAKYPGLFSQGSEMPAGSYIPPPSDALSTIFSEYSILTYPSPDWWAPEVPFSRSASPESIYRTQTTTAQVRNDEGGANGGQYFYVESTGGAYNSRDLFGLQWREAGYSDDVEVLVNFINIDLPTNLIGAVVRYDVWTRGRPVCYRAMIDSNGDGQINIYKDIDTPDGTQLGATYALGAVATDSVWIRFRVIGTSLKARFWTGAVGSEPTPSPEWHITATNGELYGGDVGLMLSGKDVLKCDEFGVAFDGDTASIIP